MEDHSYIAKRESLITHAERYANQLCGKMPTGDLAWSDKWNLAFHRKMESLVSEARKRGEI